LLDYGFPCYIPVYICKLHQAAYDSFILGVTPDCIIDVGEDVLEEEDSPISQHGLKGSHNTKLILPSLKSHYPSREESWNGIIVGLRGQGNYNKAGCCVLGG
jgi:hypothetical protein